MGRYTDNDNRSMQCNPNNERYYLSRGYSDEDDEDDGYEFDLVSFNERKSRESIELECRVDDSCFELFGKKVLVRHEGDRSFSMRSMCEYMLREGGIVESSMGVTVRFDSFREFFGDSFEDLRVREVIEVGSKNDLLYVYFQDVYISESYIVFFVDMYEQGYWRSGGIGEGRSWSFLSKTYDGLVGISSPGELYENFEDVFERRIEK